MKRLHVHIKVEDLDRSAKFYAALFGREPDRREADYAKWMLEDPRANISLSARGEVAGVDHAGVQVETDEELEEIAGRLKTAEAKIVQEADATCCYARSHKYWAEGPEGAVWELFRTFGDSAVFGENRIALEDDAAPQTGACCPPSA